MDAVDVFGIVCSGLFVLLVAVVSSPFLIDRYKIRELQRVEYKEYSTPDWIDKYWYLAGKARVCDGCGVEDYPVIGDWTGHYCKWCRELQMLTRHLNAHGARRLKRR